MKNYIFIFLIILSYCFAINLYAQSPYSAVFLNIDPSPNLNGMGGAFTALPTDDAFGAYYNPAQVGNFSRHNNIAFGFYPAKTNWLPKFNFSDLTFHANAFVFGYKTNFLIPISFGLGYIYSKFDLGENVWTDATGREIGTFNSYEKSSAITFGIGIEYYLRFNVGLTYKSINSNLIPQYVQVGAENRGGNGKTDALDYGILLTAPVLNIFHLENCFKNDYDLVPILDFSFGYSIHNIGDGLYYYSNSQADPLPRNARVGYAISLGIKNSTNINLLKFEFSNEARDLLVSRDTDGGINYENMFGDIDLYNNVISGKPNDEIGIYSGWRFNIFDTFQFSSGKIKGNAFIDFEKSSGYTISTRGLFLLFVKYDSNPNMKYIADHFSVTYSSSKYKTKNEILNNTQFQGIEIKIFGYW